MKKTLFLILLSFCAILTNAKGKFNIKPKGYSQSESANSNNGNQQSLLDRISGHFRLKEYSTQDQKVIETDVVTFFISKKNETSIQFNMNCAKSIDLQYVITDSKNKHKIKLTEPKEYFRLSKEINISKFRDGLCSVLVYNNKNELIHTIEFEKITQ